VRLAPGEEKHARFQGYFEERNPTKGPAK